MGLLFLMPAQAQSSYSPVTKYQASLKNWTINKMFYNRVNQSVVISWGKPMSEEVVTKLKDKNSNNENKSLRIPSSADKTELNKDALINDHIKFSYQSLFCRNRLLLILLLQRLTASKKGWWILLLLYIRNKILLNRLFSQRPRRPYLRCRIHICGIHPSSMWARRITFLHQLGRCQKGLAPGIPVM